MNKGNALQGLGRLPEAVACYDEAIAIRRDLVHAQNRVGTANDLASCALDEQGPYSFKKGFAMAEEAVGLLCRGHRLERTALVSKAGMTHLAGLLLRMIPLSP